MQVSPVKILDQSNGAVMSVVRNASCSQGWLRLVIECIFGLITVSSFIIIVVIAMKSPKTLSRDIRCLPQGCRVICEDTPYLDEFEEHIYTAISSIETSCERLFLTLLHPMFKNEKIPKFWLSGLRPNIHELTIVKGNLKYIESSAFMTSFAGNLHSLVLVNITIATWTPLMLAGLSKLEELSIRESRIGVIDSNALEPVDDTLKTLAITQAGLWNPTNVTGTSYFENLQSVVLTSNQFDSVLGPSSFARLYKCKVLYLNNCEIKALQLGTFDNLLDIEIIYLNNNYLQTLPSGLFDNIIARPYPRARILLHDNNWHCDCMATDLQQLSANGMLLVNPFCHSPKDMEGKYVSYLKEYCRNDTLIRSTIKMLTSQNSRNENLTEQKVVEIRYSSEENIVMDNSICEYKNNRELHIISPLSNFECEPYNIQPKKFPLQFISSNKNDLITPTIAVKKGDFSMVEITSLGNESYGILWYHIKCPNKVYCLNILPNVLRIYNIDYTADIVFCPLQLTVDNIDSDKCISFSTGTIDSIQAWRFLLTILTSVVCLVFGAICVYAIIRKHPTLLKGNKRILLVKHKNVDALILPPKVSPRLSLPSEELTTKMDNNDIFVVSTSPPYTFLKSKSMRSSKSTAPSYISALEPTEDQLAEWRLKHHFDNASTLTSLSLDVCTFSWIHDEKTSHTKEINEKNIDTLIQS